MVASRLDWHINSLNTYNNKTRNMPKTVKLKMQLDTTIKG